MHKSRAIFLSDIHLGTRECAADRLLEFLRHHESDYLYLVGDIVDLWAMNRSIHWSQGQNTVVQKILKRARHGVQVTLVPGNHDEALREYVGLQFGDIKIAREVIHVAANGKRYLLLHGDGFDPIVRFHKWLTLVGDRAYTVLTRMSRGVAWIRRRLGIPGYWSLAHHVRDRIQRAVEYIHEFECAVARHASHRAVDGVICGHIHAAARKKLNGIEYINCGDWVDSCTALIEGFDGQMELVRWTDVLDPAPALNAVRITALDIARKQAAVTYSHRELKQRISARWFQRGA